MNEKLKALLRKFGWSDDQIEKFSTDEEEKVKEINVDTEYKQMRENLWKSFTNDPALIDPIEKSIRGQVLSSKENKIRKKFDISKEEYDNLPESTKFDALIDLVHSKSEKPGGDEDSKEEIRKLNEELRERKDELKKLQEEEIPKIKSEVDQTLQTIKRDQQLRKIVDDHDLIIDKDFAFESIKSRLSAKYDLVLSDSGLDLKQKGSDKEAYEENRKVTPKDAVQRIIEESKIAKKSNADEDPPKRPGSTDEPEEKFKFPGMQKAKESAAQKQPKKE